MDKGLVLGCKGVDTVIIGEDATSEFRDFKGVGGTPFPVVGKGGTVFAVGFIIDSGGAGLAVDVNIPRLCRFDDDGSNLLSNLVDDLFRADDGDLDGPDRIK